MKSKYNAIALHEEIISILIGESKKNHRMKYAI